MPCHSTVSHEPSYDFFPTLARTLPAEVRSTVIFPLASAVVFPTRTRSLPEAGVSVTDLSPASSWTVMSEFAFVVVEVTFAGL